ncbi:DNA alkylation repair protein [Shewanella marina]|uniref:DNA alkylation repair protein n=1 Tax=Shewanella marina TaxID=487319 RepID=UPI000471F0EF|nr:DNA alkylation repair protein [Shewanella marina]
MSPWVEATKVALVPLANADNASAMKSYMRNQFAFYGIQSVPRRAAMKPLFAKNQLPSIEALPIVINELWSLPEREFQLVAVDLLILFKKQLPVSMLANVEVLITTKSWWDTVDFLATHIVGSLAMRYPIESAKFINVWRNSDNLWLRRTSLLYQLKYKDDTDTELLFSLIKQNQFDNEFFIQKAIGWMLREYSKTNADAVVEFINTQHIQGLAKREGIKWLKSHGYSQK